MKKIFYILFFFLFSLPKGKGWGWAVTAQNLVPNSSFEEIVPYYDNTVGLQEWDGFEN